MMRLLVLLITLFSLPALADIYKCRLPNGRTEISNSPCPGGSGTLTARPDETVSEQSRQQAERDVERMRNYVERREEAQRADQAAEREQQAAERQAATQQRVYQSDSMDECLRELAQQVLEPARRAELEAICRAKARNEPGTVPVPVYGGVGGNPVSICIDNVRRQRLAPGEHSRRIAQCQGGYGQAPVPMPHSHPRPRPDGDPDSRPEPRPIAKPGKPCPRGDLYCVR